MGQPDFIDIHYDPKQTKTRRVKKVHVHRSYTGFNGNDTTENEDMPDYDFALIEVDKHMYKDNPRYNYKFGPTMRPICLPKKEMRKRKFVNQLSLVSGYGRVEAIEVPGKDQLPWRLMQAYLKIIGGEDEKCSEVTINYNTISTHNWLVQCSAQRSEVHF